MQLVLSSRPRSEGQSLAFGFFTMRQPLAFRFFIILNIGLNIGPEHVAHRFPARSWFDGSDAQCR